MKTIGLMVTTLLVSPALTQAAASQPVDAAAPCAIDTIDSSLRSVLMMIARNKGTRVHLSEKVSGVVSGSVQNATCDQLFDFLLNSFNLVVFRDGEILHISTIEEVASEVIYIDSGSPADIIAQIKKLGLWGEGDGIRYSPESKVLYVSGHKKYVEIIKQIADEFENQDDVKVLYGGLRSSRPAGAAGKGRHLKDEPHRKKTEVLPGSFQGPELHQGSSEAVRLAAGTDDRR